MVALTQEKGRGRFRVSRELMCERLQSWLIGAIRFTTTAVIHRGHYIEFHGTSPLFPSAPSIDEPPLFEIEITREHNEIYISRIYRV